MTAYEQKTGSQAARRASSRRLQASFAVLVLLALTALAAFFFLATPRIVPADPDPANPTVPSFSITNPNPLVALMDVQWYCFLSVPGPNSGLQLFPEPPPGGRLEPGATVRRPCINKPVADGQRLVLSLHVRYKIWSIERATAGRQFYWQVERRQGRWVAADAPTTSSTTTTRP